MPFISVEPEVLVRFSSPQIIVISGQLYEKMKQEKRIREEIKHFGYKFSESFEVDIMRHLLNV